MSSEVSAATVTRSYTVRSMRSPLKAKAHRLFQHPRGARHRPDRQAARYTTCKTTGMTSWKRTALGLPGDHPRLRDRKPISLRRRHPQYRHLQQSRPALLYSVVPQHRRRMVRERSSHPGTHPILGWTKDPGASTIRACLYSSAVIRQLRSHVGFAASLSIDPPGPICRGLTRTQTVGVRQPRKIPERTALRPAVRVTVTVSVPPAATLIGALTQAP